MNKHFTFDANGTRFRITLAEHPDGVLIALPDFYWAVTVSKHAPPDAGWLRSHGLENHADAASLADYLGGHWLALLVLL